MVELVEPPRYLDAIAVMCANAAFVEAFIATMCAQKCSTSTTAGDAQFAKPRRIAKS